MRRSALDRTGAGLLRDANGDAVDSMVSIGKPPWHYAENAELIRLRRQGETLTSKDVNELAGLTWTVYQSPAYLYVGRQPDLRENGFLAQPASAGVGRGFKLVGTQRNPGSVPEPDYYLNVRDDIHRVVGIVKKRYRVFQNLEAPIFLDNLVDSGDAIYETAGSLHGGSQVWWLMKLPEGVAVAGDAREELETYILLTNSHDGSTSIVVAIVTIRVVCQNTLAWSLGNALRTMKIRHTESAKEQFMEARRTLELGFTYQSELLTIGDQMLHTPFSDDHFQTFLDSLVPTPEAVVKDNKVTNQRGITMANNTKREITNIYYHHETQTHLTGTLWGAVQAVQNYSDHLSISRTTDDAKPEENRFKRLTSGANLGSKGFREALACL
jgi:phage/plasmid-like protein (TIGR03299 family)